MKNQNAIRLKRVIESDRMNMTVEGTELIIKDIECVLKEYFHLSSKPELSLKLVSGEYRVEIVFFADALKTFTPIA